MKLLGLAFSLLSAASACAQSIAVPWSGLAHDPQHSDISKAPVPAQALGHIKWTTPVDLMPQYTGGGGLLIHYGSPLITRQNTVIVPVKTGATDTFRVEGHDATNGSTKWTELSDYSLPTHNWTPSYGIALTPKNRVYFAGAGGTVYYRDTPDAATGTRGQIAFYGLANYTAGKATFDANVKINTPITSDRYGNIYFGFFVSSPTTNPSLQSGIARIAEDGTGSWIAASTAAGDGTITKVVHNCAPGLSNDHKTLYGAVSFSASSGGYLVALDSRTLTPLGKVRLKDVHTPANDAKLSDDGSASPTIGPDGDVYFGVLDNPIGSNHYRGWLLHFNNSLAQTKTPGAFGWDDTASIVFASLVPSYHGSSAYLLLTKYNNYKNWSGDGVNKLAVLDPSASMTDPITGATVMAEVITVVGPTPDGAAPAVKEWCINAAAIDPSTKSGLVTSEDGKAYRWDFTTNTLSQTLTLTTGLGEAYTPTMVGFDGTVYAIANATLFAIGQ